VRVSRGQERIRSAARLGHPRAGGYTPEDNLPSYRIVPAPLLVDAVRGNAQITGQQYPESALPDVVQGKTTEQMKLYDGVGQIAALLKQPQIKLQPPDASTVVRLMNLEIGDPYQQIVSLYWAVAHAAIEGVLDQIRTALTKLVAELRANMATGEALPSPEAANNAITFVVTGRRNRINFTAPQASGAGASAEVQSQAPEPDGSKFRTRSRRIGAFVVGGFTIAGATAAIIEFIFH
jgi:hypothetical protein